MTATLLGGIASRSKMRAARRYRANALQPSCSCFRSGAVRCCCIAASRVGERPICEQIWLPGLTKSTSLLMLQCSKTSDESFEDDPA